MLERPSSCAMRSLRRPCGRLSRPVAVAVAAAAQHFSTSPACGVRAIFAETQNAELNSTLAEIQAKIILPAYLPEKQHDQVFNPKMRTHLEQNPIVIEVEGLEHKFSTIDPFSGDVPNSKKILNTALRQMRPEPEDWANLATLLAGYKRAGIRLQPDLWAKIVRAAGDSGNIWAVIECAKQADRTGLRLDGAEGVALVFSHINEKIVGSSGDPAQTRQALKWAEVVLDLMQRPPHEAEGLPPRLRLHFSRIVRGLTLFTRASAIKAKQQAPPTEEEGGDKQETDKEGENEQDHKAKGDEVEAQQQEQQQTQSVEQDLVLLKDEVDLLASLWKGRETEDLTQAPDFAQLNPVVERASGAEDSKKGVKTPRALNGTAYMRMLAQNIKGMSLARELLGADAAKALAPIEANLSSHLEQHAQTRKKSSNWAQQYENIVGHAPQW